MDEVWRDVRGHEGLYEVSSHGRVRSFERRGVYAGRYRPTMMVFPAIDMRICTTRNGYKYVALKKPNGPSIKYSLHRLVMAAHVGDPPEGRGQVNHIDGDKANNHLENLEYCSAQENLLHLTRCLGRKRGGSGAKSKLTEAQAISVLRDGRILREIAAEYGVSIQAIHHIKSGRNWAHLSSTEDEYMAPLRALKKDLS